MADPGAHATEEDPAAAFLAQQETEIAVIENEDEDEGFGAVEAADDQQSPEPQPTNYGKLVTELTAASTSVTTC